MATVVALVLALSLCACSTPAPAATEAPAVTTAPAQNTAVPTATAAATQAPEVPAEPMDISWMASGAPLEPNSWGELTFNEVFNVKLEIIQAEDDAERNVLFASGVVPDFIAVSNINQLTSYTDQGLLAEVPISMIEQNMPTYYPMCISYDPNFFTYSIINDQNMGVAKFRATSTAPIAAAIRADWLTNVGIDKVPSTIEELEAAFVAFVQNDPDGNGKADTYGMSSAGGEPRRAVNRRLFPSIFGAFGISPYWWTEDGNGGVQMGFTTQAFKDAITLLAKWYQMGLIDPEFVTDELRNSGEDVVFKFASGRTGYIDGSPFDDYEWDNDGHVNGKWVANNAEWQAFFADNADSDEMYKYNVTTDFDSSFINPYYISLPPVAGPSGVVGGYMREELVSGYIGFGYKITEEKMAKLLSIFEAEAMDEDVYVLHYGAEGEQWMYDDAGNRVYNPNWTESPVYHPQGRIQGAGFCLFQMYYANPDLLTAVGGPRYEQRYTHTMPVFEGFTTFQDALSTASLQAAADNPDLLSTNIISYIIRTVRGEMDLESTFDATVQKWMSDGGEELTKQANDHWNQMQ